MGPQRLRLDSERLESAPHPLSTAFFQRQSEPPTAELLAAWNARLQTWIELARSRYPDIEVDAAMWCEHLGTSFDDPAPFEALEHERVEELFLAFASARGDAVAVAELRRRFGPDVERALTRGRGGALDLEDLRQRIWVKLLVEGPGGAPQLLRYAGRGSLQGWIRVVVSRMVIDLRRSHGANRERPSGPDMLGELVATATQPQFRILRDRYGETVKAAMYAAFEGLTTRDRRLLRGRLVDGLTTDALGVMFGVHRTTIARWLDAAQASLVEATHAALQQQVGAGEQTVRSLVQMVRSQLDISVARLLDEGD